MHFSCIQLATQQGYKLFAVLGQRKRFEYEYEKICLRVRITTQLVFPVFKYQCILSFPPEIPSNGHNFKLSQQRNRDGDIKDIGNIYSQL